VRVALAVAAALLLLPELASACAVCFGNEEENRAAFILTTVLLSVLPLALIGSLGLYLWSHHRREARQPGSAGASAQSSGTAPAAAARSGSV